MSSCNALIKFADHPTKMMNIEYNWIVVPQERKSINKQKGILNREDLMKEITSTRETKDAIIMAKASPASNEGAPHWNGYGILILQTQNPWQIPLNKFQITM